MNYKVRHATMPSKRTSIYNMLVHCVTIFVYFSLNLVVVDAVLF